MLPCTAAVLGLLIYLGLLDELVNCLWLVDSIAFSVSVLELCENLPAEGRETVIMIQILPYIKVSVTSFDFAYPTYEALST